MQQILYKYEVRLLLHTNLVDLDQAMIILESPVLQINQMIAFELIISGLRLKHKFFHPTIRQYRTLIS